MSPLARLMILLFANAVPAGAEEAAKLPVVGVMRVNAATNNAPLATLFREGLAARGYVEGRNLGLDIRLANVDTQQFSEMVEALVKEKVSVIVVFGDPAARAAQRATLSIPIVALASELVASGLITKLTKPGGTLPSSTCWCPSSGQRVWKY